ncbi:hypothetical protein [Ochrobactrum sp. MYb379]|uniref:hypothetical protein n=1 Tax=Ochrobactrum sp. MYb379 TaxID=2745275 RepID=UPI0030A886AE
MTLTAGLDVGVSDSIPTGGALVATATLTIVATSAASDIVFVVSKASTNGAVIVGGDHDLRP